MPDGQERGAVTLLVAIGQRNGSEVHVEVYREAGKPPLLSIALYRRTRAGAVLRDGGRTLRFFPDEWRVLAQGVNLALAELDRLKGRA